MSPTHLERPTSWVEFVLAGSSPTGKTLLWEVRARADGGMLGVVKWFGRWRCYAFHPSRETIFERRCLRDIAAFCEDETHQHQRKEPGK